MEKLLSDRRKFAKTEFDSKDTVNQDIRNLLDIKSEIKSYLDDLLDKNCLSKDDYKYFKHLNISGSKAGIMYGLCKIHKDTTLNDPVSPFRPVLSAIGTCSYNLTKSFCTSTWNVYY